MKKPDVTSIVPLLEADQLTIPMVNNILHNLGYLPDVAEALFNVASRLTTESPHIVKFTTNRLAESVVLMFLSYFHGKPAYVGAEETIGILYKRYFRVQAAHDSMKELLFDPPYNASLHPAAMELVVELLDKAAQGHFDQYDEAEQSLLKIDPFVGWEYTSTLEELILA